jgi:hypothetical protein
MIGPLRPLQPILRKRLPCSAPGSEQCFRLTNGSSTCSSARSGSDCRRQGPASGAASQTFTARVGCPPAENSREPSALNHISRYPPFRRSASCPVVTSHTRTFDQPSQAATRRPFGLNATPADRAVPFPEMPGSLKVERDKGITSSQPVGVPHHGRSPTRLVVLLRPSCELAGREFAGSSFASAVCRHQEGDSRRGRIGRFHQCDRFGSHQHRDRRGQAGNGR